MGPMDETVTSDKRRLKPPRPWQLLVVHSNDETAIDRVLPLDAGPVCLGRSASEAVSAVIDDPEMSRRHATLRVDRGDLVVEDHGSKSGCFVDGERVLGSRALTEGAIVRVGGTFIEARRARLVPPMAPDPELVGEAPAHLKMLYTVRSVAPTTMPILIVGETGTGKELVARTVHRHSERAGKLVAVNCAAIPEHLLLR